MVGFSVSVEHPSALTTIFWLQLEVSPLEVEVAVQVMNVVPTG